MIKLLVFDVDGTLVDSQTVIVDCMVRAFAAHGLPPPTPSQVRRVVGLPLEIGVVEMNPSINPDLAFAVAESYRAFFQTVPMALIADEALFPGMRDLLVDLSGTGAILGVATGKGRRGLNKVIARHGLDGMFATIQTGDVPPGKPHPAMLLRAIDEAGVAPGETAMIGDTTFDMAMATAAGALPVAVAWGYHPVADLVAAGAAHVAEDADGLATLLKRLLAS